MTPIAHIEKNCWLRLPMFKTKLRCSITQRRSYRSRAFQEKIQEIVDPAVSISRAGSAMALLFLFYSFNSTSYFWHP